VLNRELEDEGLVLVVELLGDLLGNSVETVVLGGAKSYYPWKMSGLR
jgi:hypothetical protein